MLKPYQINAQPMMQTGPSATNKMLGTLGQIAGTAIGTSVGGPTGAALGSAVGSQLGNVVTGEELNASEAVMAGVTSGMSAGAKGAADAKDALSSAVATGDAATINAARDSFATAQNSLFNDPFGKMGNAAKSIFMAQGGEVEQQNKLPKFDSKMLMTGALPLMIKNPKMFGGLATMMLSEGGEVKPESNGKSKLKRDKDGKLILPETLDFSKLQPMSEAEKRERASLDQQTRSVKYKAKGGPLCSSCEAEYKACGGKMKYSR